MVLSTKQVADKLHVTPSTVAHLVKVGQLRDLRAHIKGRHTFALDAHEVTEFAKTYVRASRNGDSSTPLPGAGLNGKLDRIEGKLDQLLALWR